MENNELNSKIIHDISEILINNQEVNILVDRLIFEQDKTKKLLLIKELFNIDEIRNNIDLQPYWKSILKQYIGEIDAKLHNKIQ